MGTLGGGQVTLTHPLKAALFPVPHVCPPVNRLHLLEFKEDLNLEPWEWDAPLPGGSSLVLKGRPLCGTLGSQPVTDRQISVKNKIAKWVSA